MPLTLLGDRQYTAPSAANGVLITPSAVAWTNSAYVTLIASTPAACVLTGVTLCSATTSATADVEVDIATGAAGAEVVITTVRAYARIVASPAWGPSNCCVLPIPIDNIAAGVRVSGRLRKNNTTTTAWNLAITYLQKPLASTILTTAVAQKTLPSAAAGVTVTAGSPAWVSGAWGQLRTASGAALVITGVVVGGPSVSADYELDIGTGTAGAESVIATLRLPLTTVGLPSWTMLPTPLDNVAAGVRLAARLRCSTASTTAVASVMVFEKPL